MIIVNILTLLSQQQEVSPGSCARAADSKLHRAGELPEAASRAGEPGFQGIFPFGSVWISWASKEVLYRALKRLQRLALSLRFNYPGLDGVADKIIMQE